MYGSNVYTFIEYKKNKFIMSIHQSLCIGWHVLSSNRIVFSVIEDRLTSYAIVGLGVYSMPFAFDIVPLHIFRVVYIGD